jgi:putative oxygen-independent coproporphyrinogen III oxidase
MTDFTGLYIHVPWCIKKCPYCDFNSHQKSAELPENAYIEKLLQDFALDVSAYPRQSIQSIFIGGGTPSLLSANAYEKLFQGLQALVPWDEQIEITLEANPGTIDFERFRDYKTVGINRLSIGVQSFQEKFLKTLGRIHDGQQATLAVEKAHRAGFENINIDLMYGLPKQSVEEALLDLNMAVACKPNHISWYELTIEPNTVFYKKPPEQPQEDTFIEIEEQGRAYLKEQGFHRYEISAYGKQNVFCHHNLNYWLFGDYYGIGAGAHSKLTLSSGKLLRQAKTRMPQSYLDAAPNFCAETRIIDSAQELMFEFMLNSCRLLEPISFATFEKQTGLKRQDLMPYLSKAKDLGFIQYDSQQWQITPLGQRFNNEIIKLLL